MIKSRKIIVSVTTDLISDNRVHKVCSTLYNNGFDILLIGRKLRNNSVHLNREYKTKRFNLIFNNGFLFYAEFNIRLFFYLLFSQFDILLSNDLDTLAPNTLSAKIKGKPLIYDSHEYFTEVPELLNRPRVRKIWLLIEKLCIKKTSNRYTVSQSIAEEYQKKYNLNFTVIRNIPHQMLINSIDKASTRTRKRVIYQGALNVGRGLEQVILAMKYSQRDFELLIVGDGDIKSYLQQLVETNNLSSRVTFLGRLTIEELQTITPTADLGISIEEDLGLSYRYALPNKLFDYIQAQIPVLVTNLPEMSRIVQKYQIGAICNSLNPENLVNDISDALYNERKRNIWKENLTKAANELTWENEEKKLLTIFNQYR